LWFELGRQVALFLSGITLADVVLNDVAGRAVPLRPRTADARFRSVDAPTGD
jgi:hypothetical protein